MSTPIGDVDRQAKTKRPSNSKFKQQKLPAWQPILTAGTVMPTFFVIGILFIPIGIGLLLTSNTVTELIEDYTDCLKVGGSETCASVIRNTTGSTCVCSVSINISEDIKTDVYIYYQLENFYQNHRRYVKSRDDNQLQGGDDSLIDECKPYQQINGTNIAPCGAIANSLFNDTIRVVKVANNTDVPVDVLKTGIAWNTDKQVKFRNPASWDNTHRPPFWTKDANQLDPSDPENNGYQNEDLIVWMRTAALPTFRKLYRRVDHAKAAWKNGLPSGTYKILVDYNYPVTQFNGRKSIVISNTSWLGGKNPFLGIAYITVGCICFVLGIVFLIIHVRFGKTPQDMSNIGTRS